MRALRLTLVAVVLGGAIAVAESAAAAPQIHAHRGGSVLAGVPTYPEESMPAFRNASREGWWLELDAKLTQDGVPVVIHDATLDRTTTCTGPVAEKTLDQLGQCKLDVLGSADLTKKAENPTESILTLAQVLEFARDEGAFANLEIKNVPTDADFDSSSAFANRVMDAVIASGLPKERLIVQSFWPANLDVAEQRLPGVETSLLTLTQTNDGGPAFAASMGYEWVSPSWPVGAAYMQSARDFGRKIVPYTLNEEEEVRDAATVGVDALISDDPLMAQRTLGLSRTDLLPDGLKPTADLQAPAYASEVSRDARFPVALGGADRGSGVESFRLQVQRSVNASPRWRTVAETPNDSAQVRGRPGVAYQLRLRVRDRMGNLSLYDYDETVVPLDDRALAFGPGWRRVRSKRAWKGALTRATVAGARASARVEGGRIALIGRRSPKSGRLLVILDGRPRKVISLRGRRGPRKLVYRSRVLAPGAHRIKLKTLGGGPVDLDAVGVDPGPPPPR